MGFIFAREVYWEQKAMEDSAIAHKQPVAFGSDKLRNSFYKVNDLEELLAASKNWAHFPCMVMFSVSGNDRNKDGAWVQENSTVLLFLDRMILGNSVTNNAAAISRSYDIAFDAMQRVKAAVYADVEDDECDGPFRKVYPASWEMDGPLGDNLYGWIFEMKDETGI